jgi:hypothetical protein
VTGEAPAVLPFEFEQALLSLRGHNLRPELHLQEVPPPTRVAPYALALTAEVNPTPDPDTLLGSGRFVVLYDPAGQEAWNGSFRVIAMGTAKLERELGADPFLGEVGWAWLTDALSEEGARYHSLSGSVTRVLSESFGGLELRDFEVEIEIRASWTPVTHDLSAHLRAWALMTCSASGLPPVPENVATLGRRR